MSKVIVKYFLLCFILLQHGSAYLNAESIENFVSLSSSESQGQIDLNDVSENEFSFTNAPFSSSEKWPIVFNEFEIEEKNETESSKEYSETSHPFLAFLGSSTTQVYLSKHLKDLVSINGCFPSFCSLYLKYQVFRL